MSILYRRLKSIRAFTLVELLVVIAIVALLVAIVLPQVNNAFFRGKLTATAANGRSIHQSIFAYSTEQVYTTAEASWPTSDEKAYYENDSAKYFEFLVTNGIMNVSYSFFAAEGVPTYKKPPNSDPDFTGEYCAWNVVLDVTDNTAETLPVLFTRNLDIDRLDDGQLYAPDAQGISEGLDEVMKPFGKRGLAFVTKGGAALAPFRNDLKVENFESIFNIQIQTSQGYEDADNEVLKADTGTGGG